MVLSKGKDDSEPNLKKNIIPVAVILLLVAVTVVAAFLYHPPADNKPYVFSGISFPEDEGMHSDVGESWTIYLRFKTENGGSYYFTSTYYYQDLKTFGINSGRDAMLVNLITGEKINQHLDNGTSLTGTEDRLALLFQYRNDYDGFSFYDTLKKNNGTVLYDYHTEIYDREDLRVKADIRMHDLLGKPVIPTSDGRIYIPGQATFYGYFQPRIQVSGEITVDGKNMTITDGTGVINHFWGAYSAAIVGDEFIVDIPTGYTVIAAKYVYAGNGTEAISAMVVVNPDGTYDIIDRPTINITPMKYFLAPYDIMEQITWAYQWQLETPEHGMNMTITGVVIDQMPYYNWEGTCYANGTFDSKNYETVAFAEITHHYVSQINIDQVQLTQNTEVPTGDMRVSCEVNHTLPLKSILLWYNTSRDGNWTSVPMTVKYADYPNFWEAYIPGQKLQTTVNYYIEVVDAANHVRRSPMQNHTVEIEYPE